MAKEKQDTLKRCLSLSVCVCVSQDTLKRCLSLPALLPLSLSPSFLHTLPPPSVRPSHASLPLLRGC